MSKVKAGQVFVEIGGDPRKLFAALSKVQRQIGRMGSAVQSAGSRMAGVGAAIAAPFAMASRQFAVFDDAIRATAAVSGASGNELQKLNDTARDLGATTSFTAVQVANLMTELGRAGFKPDEINAMTGAVLDLARATGTDATLASGIMAATLRQFSLGAGDAARAADVLTKAANSTFNTVESLGEALKYAGPVAKSLGMSFEDTTAILGVLGNVGIQGSEAGTALRRLSVISAGSGEELKKLFNVSNTDAAGNLKPLVDILDEINTVTANMPVAERTAKMAQAFGLLGITSANVLSSSAEGVRGLADSLRNAQGTAAKTAKEMDAGLGGSIRIMLSAIEGLALAIGDALAPSLQKMMQGIIDVAGGITKFVKDNQSLVVSVAKGVAGFIAAGAGLYVFGTALKVTSGAIGVVLGAIKLIPVALSVAFGPIGLLAAAIAAVVMLGPQLKTAFAGVFEGLGSAAESVGGVFASMASDAAVVFGDLANTATSTFNGIYDAIANGDLAGAMDVLWAGLQAGWLRGVEALMGAVDPWISMFQNAFTILGAEIYKVWDTIWVNVSNSFNTFGAYLQGAFDNVINTVMASWDTLEAGIRKSWNYVQSFFKKGFDLKKENEKVDNEMDARRRKRELERPGVEGRTKKAAEENARANRDLADRRKGVDANTQATIDQREGRNAQRREERRAATQAAEDRLSGLTRGQRDTRVFRGQADEAIGRLGSASTMEEVQAIAEEFHLLAETGKLTAEQQKKYADAVEAAQERIETARGEIGVGGAAPVDPASVQRAAMEAAAKQSEVAGTFSAASVGGMGFAQSLQQKANELLGRIEQNTRVSDDGVVAA